MLEAFQASSELQEPTPPSGAQASKPEPAPAGQRRAKSGVPDVAPELFAVVLCVLVIGSFFLGRWSVGSTVRAGEKEVHTVQPTVPPAATAQPVPTVIHTEAPAEATATDTAASSEWAPAGELKPGTLAMLDANTQAFHDKANKYTVRVDSFDNNEAGQRRALKTALYLSELDFPAMAPILRGDDIFLCVGASPSTQDVDLLRMMRELKEIAGPPPARRSKEFGDAYLDNIDHLISR